MHSTSKICGEYIKLLAVKSGYDLICSKENLHRTKPNKLINFDFVRLQRNRNKLKASFSY